MATHETALHVVDVPTDSTAVARYDTSGLPTVHRMREQLTLQREWRALLLEYVKEAMDPDRHFYRISDSDKPALSQDGARMLCALYEVHTGDTVFEEHLAEDGHYRVRATVILLSKSGTVVAQGTGTCSTLESKYAYRWVFDNDVPRDLPKADLRKRPLRKGGFMYRIPNQDLADQYNTILKMAEKRAHTAATLRLPYAAEVFAETPDEEQPHEQAEHQAVMGALRRWMGTQPAKAREGIAQAVFGCALAGVAGLALEPLQRGWEVIQTVQHRVNWQSATLSEDLKTAQAQSAKQATSDLFNRSDGDPRTMDAIEPEQTPVDDLDGSF